MSLDSITFIGKLLDGHPKMILESHEVKQSLLLIGFITADQLSTQHYH